VQINILMRLSIMLFIFPLMSIFGGESINKNSPTDCDEALKKSELRNLLKLGLIFEEAGNPLTGLGTIVVRVKIEEGSKRGSCDAYKFYEKLILDRIVERLEKLNIEVIKDVNKEFKICKFDQALMTFSLMVNPIGKTTYTCQGPVHDAYAYLLGISLLQKAYFKIVEADNSLRLVSSGCFSWEPQSTPEFGISSDPISIFRQKTEMWISEFICDFKKPSG